MKFLRYEVSGKPHLGVVSRDETGVIDVAVAGVDTDLLEIIRDGTTMESVRRAMATATAEPVPFADIRVLAPFPRPQRNVFCVGKNYYAHAEEFQRSGYDATAASAVPEFPIVFTKATTTVIGPEEAIPASSDPENSVDYEGELAVVIGQGGRRISRDRAFDHVFGYTIVNDVTSRGLQRKHAQWFLGKSLDGFCPMGPLVATADEIPDIRACTLTTTINGEVRQEATVAQMIFDIPTLIETISTYVTLESGDIIATGTPEGVGIGFDPPKFLVPGDRVSIRIDGLGELSNPVS